jgi:DNA-binding CsgD family transcriptional regulator
LIPALELRETRSERVHAWTGQLLERGEELSRIETALAEASGGSGRLVVIEGPAGIGKTALLSKARRIAAENGMRVLRARGAELECDFAFGVVRQLFEAVLADASDRERAELLQGHAGTAASLLSLPGASGVAEPPSSTGGRSFEILHGLYWLCANLAAAGPICVVVDDAHWADVPSLRFLTFLVTRLEELRVALVVGSRPGEPGGEAELLVRVTTDPSAEVIRLPPLTRAGVAELVESRLGVADRIFVDACLQATRGTPFLVSQLLDALRDEGIPPDAESAGAVERIGARTVGRSIRLRIDRLPAEAGRLARALAILEQSDLLPVARLAAVELDEAAEAADLLEAAGIIDATRPLTFVHPIVRSGIYFELSLTERTEGHARAARMLAEQPGKEEQVAEHLLVSDSAGDAWVVERLVEAARAAERKGAPESAAVFLRRALAEPPLPRDQPALLLELGKAEANAGLTGWLEHLQRAADTTPHGVAAAEAAMVLGRALTRAQCYVQAMEVLDRAASTLDSSEDDLAGALEAEAVIAGMNHPATARSMAFRRQALRERADSDPSAPAELLAVAAVVALVSNEPAEVVAELATRALLTEEAALDSTPWFSSSTFARAILSLLWAERYDDAQPGLDVAIAQARMSGDGGRLSSCLAVRAWSALRRGDLHAAEADARTALTATELPAPPMYRALNGGVLVKALADQGRLDDAEEALASLGAHVTSGFVTDAILRLARGRLHVERGRIADALDDFLGVGEVLTGAHVTAPSFLPWRSEAALAQLALGDHTSAKTLAEEELRLAQAFGAHRARGVARRAAGIVAGGDRGVSLLRAAIGDFEHGGARLERARALADLGAMLRRRNRRTEARELLREALDVAHRAGARSLADYAETELRATGARPRRVVLTGLDSLTASERRIAEHASHGLTNREIARALFVTGRTVEGHLTSIFRKLQLQSRSELAAVLESGNTEPPQLILA